jgi:Zn-dependent M28 family amino/carboxypeptidase
MGVEAILTDDIESAAATIEAKELLEHVRILSSDEFEGRAPGTKGEEKTVEYICKTFADLGLKSFPGARPYCQSVPLVGCTSHPTLQIRSGARVMSPRRADDYTIMSGQFAANSSTSSPMVFVGYGIVAPEYGWDDYKGVDVRGKTLVMLVGDPPIKDAGNPDVLDTNMFDGSRMTYYGRWTYKYEIAAEKGAAAAIIVHDTEAASYPYDVVKNSWSGERLELRHSTRPRPQYEGWITTDFAVEMFREAGFDFHELKGRACTKQFAPIDMPLEATCELQCDLREFQSDNVIGYIEGSDPELRKEAVMYSAHWDHFGIDKSGKGIYAGAADNGTGVACLLSLAAAFARLKERPKRTTIFFATTAEEHNLLGAKHYSEQPLFPLERTVAVINMDCLNVWGRTKSIISILDGRSTLDEPLKELARSQGRTIVPDAEPEKGSCFRSDHFEMMRKGIPCLLFMEQGANYIDKPPEFEKKMKHEFVSCHYHKVTDVINDSWDLSGLAEDTQLFFRLGAIVANTRERPQWLPEGKKGMGFLEPATV